MLMTSSDVKNIFAFFVLVWKIIINDLAIDFDHISNGI